MLHVAVAKTSSDDSAVSYVLPILWITSCFHIMEQWVRMKERCVSSSSPGGGTSGKVAVYNCRLVLV